MVLGGIDLSIKIVEVPFQLVKAANPLRFPQAFANRPHERGVSPPDRIVGLCGIGCRWEVMHRDEGW